jgi:hypothetical protein
MLRLAIAIGGLRLVAGHDTVSLDEDVKGRESGPVPIMSTCLALGIVILTLSYDEYRQQI